jgi:hypothetical protein
MTRNLQQSQIEQICIDTFGYSLPELSNAATRGFNTPDDKDKGYKLKCLAYWLYHNQFGATFSSVGEQIGKSSDATCFCINYMRKELSKVKNAKI